MSRVYFHGKHMTSELLGAERAYMGVTINDLAATVISTSFVMPGTYHPIAALVPQEKQEDFKQRPLEDRRAYQEVDQQAAMYLRTIMRDNILTFGGETYSVANMVGNTGTCFGPVFALMTKIHNYCESHLAIPEEWRDWAAGVMEAGRARNVLRPGMGWEDVISHLRNGDGGPVVMSYSVCEPFPSMEACGWMDEGWPERERGTYNYDRLTDEEKQAVEDRQEQWYDLPDDERWNRAMAGIAPKHWLHLTPDNLEKPTFLEPVTLFDAVASEEWRSK